MSGEGPVGAIAFLLEFLSNFPLKRGLSARFLLLFFFQRPLTDARPPRNNRRSEAGTRCTRRARRVIKRREIKPVLRGDTTPGEIRGPINEINEYRFQSAATRLANPARLARLTERPIAMRRERDEETRTGGRNRGIKVGESQRKAV